MLKMYTQLFLVVFLLTVMIGTAHAEPLPGNSVYAEDFVSRNLQVTDTFDYKPLELKLCGDTFMVELLEPDVGTYTINAEVVFVYKVGDNYICVTEEANLTSGKTAKLTVRKQGAIVTYAVITIKADTLHKTLEIGDIEYKNKALRRKYEHSGYCEYEIDKVLKYATVTGYVGNSEDITIPYSIDGCTVTTIGDKAFYDNDNIKSMHMPNSVTKVGNSSFESCDELSYVKLSEGIKEIGSSAFRDCPKLSGVILPSTLTWMENDVFRGCDSVLELNIPARVENIGNMALACKNLTSLTVDEKNEKYYSVDNCILLDSSNYGLTLIAACQNFKLPEGINCMRGSFYDCDWLTEITIPESVTEIGDYTFCECENLKNIELPEKLMRIGRNAFENTGLTEIVIPETVAEIKAGAFSGMQIAEISIPKGITGIANNLFANCRQLEKVNFLGKVTEIGSNAFKDCEKLKTIELSDEITAIAPSTFYGCKSLAEISIPKDVSRIGMAAFWDCENLRTIELPNGIGVIEEGLFVRCKNLNKFVIPNGVKQIKRWGFWGCENLKELYIPATVAEIGEEVFADIEKTVVIYGEEGSYAEKYASDNGIAFVSTDYYNIVQ